MGILYQLIGQPKDRHQGAQEDADEDLRGGNDDDDQYDHEADPAEQKNIMKH